MAITNYSRKSHTAARWNLFGDYKLNDKWSLAVNANNLFDKHYYRTIGYHY